MSDDIIGGGDPVIVQRQVTETERERLFRESEEASMKKKKKDKPKKNDYTEGFLRSYGK